MKYSQSKRQEIKRRSLSLPLSTVGKTIDEATALAIMEDLKRSGSSIPAHLEEQIQNLSVELSYKTSEIPRQFLQGIVARAIIAGAAQVVSDTGQAQLEL